MDERVKKAEQEKMGIYAELGKRYVRRNSEQVRQEEKELIQKLDKLNDIVREYRIQQAKEKGLILCPNCDAEIMSDSVFCNYCGMSIVDYLESNKKMICPNCEEEVEEPGKQMYCIYCGTKLV